MKQGSYVEVHRGTEGPRHDPYSYSEITVHRADGRWAKIHLGLAEWMKYYNGVSEQHFDPARGSQLDSDGVKGLCYTFELLIGIHPQHAEKIPDMLEQRRLKYHKCGNKHLVHTTGFPGESMLYCKQCSDMFYYHFDRSAVE